jgi:hypothetical protein
MPKHSDSYLLVKAKAGLGNRILSAITGIIFSRLTRRRLIVDWSDPTYSDDGTNVFPLLFSCPDMDAPLSIPVTDSVSPSLWRGRMHKDTAEVVQAVDPSAHNSRRGYRKFSTELNRLDAPETILVMWSYTHLIQRLRRHFRGDFAHLACKSDDEIIADFLSTTLIPRPTIRARVDKWASEHFGPNPVIGTHVRFTDNRRTPIGNYISAIDKICDKLTDPTIFLATDNLEAQRAIAKRYKKVISTEKWFPASGHSMHDNPDCPNRLNNAIEALIDMYLLAKCNYLVFPGSSTFSYISSLYIDTPRINIVDIERFDPIVHLKRLTRYWLT